MTMETVKYGKYTFKPNYKGQYRLLVKALVPVVNNKEEIEYKERTQIAIGTIKEREGEIIVFHVELANSKSRLLGPDNKPVEDKELMLEDIINMFNHFN